MTAGGQTRAARLLEMVSSKETFTRTLQIRSRPAGLSAKLKAASSSNSAEFTRMQRQGETARLVVDPPKGRVC